MISRVYVKLKAKATFVDSYLISHTFSDDKLLRIASSLTNPILEEFSIDKFPTSAIQAKNFTYAIEIGFKPGVTDNVGHTVKEMIVDLLQLKDSSGIAVYTSKILLISDKITSVEAERVALTLHNPLIERSTVMSYTDIITYKGFPNKIPEVVLKESDPIITVSLQVGDDELVKIGQEGIMDNGSRRGPLALDLSSMKAIAEYFKTLKRDPTDIELETFAQTWSEHCKHTIFGNPIDDVTGGLYRTYIKGATNLIRKQKGSKDFCLSVFSDNAGGITFDKDFMITHKVETHNAPSFLDPFGGAITGIVGVNRDTIGFGLGAKPIANMYGFCFGEPNDQRHLFLDKEGKKKMLLPKRIMDGVIKGINAGGNTSGIPTVSGFMKFDDRYRGRPLVFAGTVGLMPRKVGERLSYDKKAEPGDYVVMVGGRVGADGIHGATFSSVTTDSNSPATAVQIGDPITQKKLSDAIVKEARDMDLYNSITDNGAGGLSSSVAEMAKESGGVKIDLDKVPLKYPGLRPWEIWISESQERMTLAVPPAKWETFRQLMLSRGVEATAIGEFNASGQCVVEYKGSKIMDLSMDFLHNGLPKHHLITESFVRKIGEPTLPNGISRTKYLEDLLAVNNLGGFSFISEQYDHEVQASSVLKPLSGAGRINTESQIFRPVLNSDKGVVVSSALYPSYGDISSYDMAAAAIDTAIRNAVSAGGTMSHLALLDNFCWSSSQEKTRLYELKEAVQACFNYSVGYGTPFISGKDSMFNNFKGYDERGNPIAIAVPPTLVISAIGVMPNIYKAVSPEFKNAGDIIYLLGETKDELGGSEYFKMLAGGQNNNIGSNVPKVSFEKNTKIYLALEKAIQKELLNSSLSVTSGGLAIAIAKASIGGMLGCNINLTDLGGSPTSADAKLFSESQGRILISVSLKNAKSLEKIIKNIPYTKLGKVTTDGRVAIADNKKKLVESKLKKLHDIYHKFSDSQK